MKRKITKFQLFKILCLIAYIGCVGVLIFESCLDGKASASQSNAVGGGIADILNGINGDQTVAVKPTSLTIDDKDQYQTFYVGDTLTITTTTSPTDATYKEVLYSSSDATIATINDEGFVTFLQSGKVTLTVTNEKYIEISDSIEIEVLNVNATSVTAQILNATLNEENIYTLYVDDANDYQIVSTVYPNNATFKDVVISTEASTYFSIDSDGKISNLKDSKGKISTIYVSCHCGELTEELKVIVDIKNKVILEDIIFSAASNNIYVTESAKLNISFNPSNATYKSYTVTSSNPKIVSVTQTTIKGVAAGTAIITIKSTEYDIEKSIEVTVLPQPNITSFKASLASKMIEKESKTITISNILPNKYALKSSLVYSSSDTSIATVNSSGKVTTKKAGNVIITVKTKDGSFKQDLTLIVEKYIPPVQEDNHVLGFIDKTFEQKTFNTSTIDLSAYYKVLDTEWLYDDSGKTTGDKTLQYVLDDESVNSINGSILTVNEPGEIKIVMQHIASGQSIEFSLIAINPFNIVDSLNNNLEQISITSKTEFVFNIQDLNLEHPQPYSIKIVDKYNNTIKNDPIIVNNDNSSYTLRSFYNDGEYKVIITPEYNQVLFDEFSKTINVTITHITFDSVNFDIVDNENNIIHVEDNSLTMFKNDKYHFVDLIDTSATKYDLSYISSDKNIAYVNEYNELVIKRIGEVDITLLDKVSKSEKTIHITIYNKILINEESPVTVSGTDVTYDTKSNTYSITNGYSSKLKVNFLEESTYKVVTYTSSNEKILSVGKDGTLTPHSIGKVIVTLTCNDGMLEKTEITINIEVKSQPLIKDLSEFFYQVRKALGHFGAFLVCGIFSTFTFMLFFTKKKWFFSVPLNFILGFGLAFLTEYIQTFVPGRYGAWSDVVIDFSGFSCSAVVLTISIFIAYFVKFLKARKANN